MGRKSSIDALPQDILKQLQALLADPRMTQLEITAQINELLVDRGEDPISKSALNRFSQKMDVIGKRLQEQHQIADMWIGKFGRLPQGQLGQLIIQMVQGLVFDAGLKLSEAGITDEEMPGTVKMLKDMAMMIERTERASSMNARREKEIRLQEREVAAEKVEAAAVARGMNAEEVKFWREQVLMGI